MKLKRLKESNEIPTSSMSDIAFLLIVFFMLTAVFTSTQGLRFRYPDDDPTNTNIQPEEAVHIRIDGDGQFLVDKVSMTLEELGGYIKSKMEQSPEKPVIIQTMPQVPYYAMIDVFDLLKQLNVRNVSIPTKTEIERWKQFGVF